MTDGIGTVVIGRNEGDRLRRCLLSVPPRHPRAVYVDSASTDGSVVVARELGFEVVELDSSQPLNAARARHHGFLRLLQLFPELKLVLFIDGDCELVNGWIDHALSQLDMRPDVAVICGRRRERYPERSIFNRICDIEWDTPIGDAAACGGDSIMRVQAYRDAGGFNPSVVAGEEPELCQRIRRHGWKILRTNADMTWHDANLTMVSQWWRREFRTGYGGLDVQHRFGVRDFASINLKSRLWTLGWPLAVCAFGGLGAAVGGAVTALAVSGLLFSLLPLQMLRLAVRARRRGLPIREALGYGTLIMLAKWPQALGQLRNILDRRTGSHSRSIDCKVAKPEKSHWETDLSRYPRRPWLKEQSIWAIAVHRYGRWVDGLRRGFAQQVATKLYWLLFRITETFTGISLPKEASIGPGLRIHHFGNIFIHPDVRIGANCTLRHGVTIGNRVPGGPVPIVGNDVEFGAYAQVFGEVTIGDGAKIGAMSVVLKDVPAGATAVGNPARVIVATALPQETHHHVTASRASAGSHEPA